MPSQWGIQELHCTSALTEIRKAVVVDADFSRIVTHKERRVEQVLDRLDAASHESVRYAQSCGGALVHERLGSLSEALGVDHHFEQRLAVLTLAQRRLQHLQAPGLGVLAIFLYTPTQYNISHCISSSALQQPRPTLFVYSVGCASCAVVSC